MDSPCCEIENVSIKQVKNYNYLNNAATENGKCETEIRNPIGIVKVDFQKRCNVLRDIYFFLKGNDLCAKPLFNI